jgi:lysyl-tRNA synthetase class I
MDREVLKLMAHIDQTRTEVRTALDRMDPDDQIELFRDCAAGRLGGMDERVQQLVGMLAAMTICAIWQSREDEDDWTPPGPACPKCGEDDIDHLVWQDDEKVRCTSCGTVYDPNLPDEDEKPDAEA